MLLFMQKGHLQIREEAQKFALEKGDCLLLRPDRTHAGTAPVEETVTYYWLHFEIEEDAELAIPPCSTVAHPDILADYFRRYISYQSMGLLQSRQCRILTMLILTEVAHHRKDPQGVSRNALANTAMDYIRNHIQPLSTSEIACALGCNPDYLGRIFKRTYGVTVTEAIYRQRIILARQLLHEQDLPIYETAFNCGYDDPAYFCRTFKKYTGMTPMEYRRKHSRHHVVQKEI